MTDSNSTEDIKKTSATDAVPVNAIDVLCFLGAIALTLACIYLYRSSENALFWSDFNYYHIMAVAASHAFIENPLAFPLLVVGSTAFNYNLIYTLPIIPVLLVFGETRDTFISALGLLYQLPYVILLALLSNQLISPSLRFTKRISFWLTVFLALSLPTLWAPTVRGYPDFQAASLVILACVLYLRDAQLKNKKTILYIGLCLALAPLIRRHFFYLSFAQAVSMFVHHLYLARLDKLKPLAYCKEYLFRWTMIGVVSLIVLFSLGFLFVQNILTNPYFDLYTSAYVSAVEGLYYLISAYGVITFSLASYGFISGYRACLFNKSNAVFVLSFCLTALLIWPLFGKHVAVHYTIYSDPFVILGTTACIIRLANLEPIKLRSYTLAILVFFWSSNFVLGLGSNSPKSLRLTKFGMLTQSLNEANPLGRLFTANYAPIKRNDIEALKSLHAFLSDETKGTKAVFIASDNGILGADILRNLERRMTGKFKAEAIKLIEPPMLDSRDALAVEGLLIADYVVITEPFKPMYRERDSKDLKVVIDCFNQSWPLAKDFAKMDSSFQLDESTTATIYQRTRPTTAEIAVQTYDRMREIVGGKLKGQPQWLSSDDKYLAHDTQKKTTYRVKTGDSSNYLISSNTVKGKFKLSFEIDEDNTINPENLSAHLVAIGKNGKSTELGNLRQTERKYSVKGNLPWQAHLVLYFPSQSQKQLTIKNLILSHDK